MNNAENYLPVLNRIADAFELYVDWAVPEPAKEAFAIKKAAKKKEQEEGRFKNLEGLAAGLAAANPSQPHSDGFPQ